MGTDIHGMFQKQLGDGSWEDVPSDYNEDRDYVLFAWLGDVRNGFGFAGCRTFKPLEPLSASRGFPEDFNMSGDDHPVKGLDYLPPCLRDELSDKWMGDHSFSYVTSEEVLNGKTSVLSQTGVIPLEEYRVWDGGQPKNGWCGGVMGEGLETSTPETITETTTHVQVTWERDLLGRLSYFIDIVRELSKTHGKIRYVFGFDS